MEEDPFVQPGEVDRVSIWIKENLLSPDNLSYSFLYGGKRIAGQEPGWLFEQSSSKLDPYRTQYLTALTDPQTGLAVRCIAVQNHKYPVVEWTLWLENTGTADTPQLSDVRAVDTVLIQPDPVAKARYEPAMKLHYFMGDYFSPNGYEPIEHIFYDNAQCDTLTLSPKGGRPTNMAFPYYRIQGEKTGALFVVSWQGQWETTFTAFGNGAVHKDGLRVAARQQFLQAKLLPGEKIRTPMIVIMPYAGTDEVRAQNLWRRWFIEFNMPRVEGELIKPFYSNYSGRVFQEMVNATEENQKQYADLFLDNGVGFDYLWMDAGWYDLGTTGSWGSTGTWKPDRKRFPGGIRAVSDYIHQRGVKALLWFEPERVASGTELADEHPQWLLDGKLLDLGNPEARQWITRRVNSLIISEGIDLYRQDFNMDPLEHWRSNEQADRQGIRENRHCRGYLQFWDDILAENPGIIIDSCASGGRRNDLETMRRSLPLHKTDYPYWDLTVKQGMHHSLFQWFPFFGSMNGPGDQSDIIYHRSALLLSYQGCENVFAEGFDFRKLAVWMQEWRETAHCMYGDYYPLTPYSRDERDWIGWQFHLPGSGEGMVQLFRRSQTPFTSGLFKLKGLDAEASYTLKNYNSCEATRLQGEHLMNTGLAVALGKCPDSALYYYHRVV